MSDGLPSIDVLVDVPFHDVDSYGIVWHGNYLKYLEISRCALLDTINYNYNEMLLSGYGWPIIETKTRHIKPAHFGQKIRVQSKLVEYENRLKIDYLITDADSGERIAKAHTVQVAVDLESEEMLFVSPAALLKRLGVES